MGKLVVKCLDAIDGARICVALKVLLKAGRRNDDIGKGEVGVLGLGDWGGRV